MATLDDRHAELLKRIWIVAFAKLCRRDVIRIVQENDVVAQIGGKLQKSGRPLAGGRSSFCVRPWNEEQEFVPVLRQTLLGVHDDLTIHINPMRRIVGFYRRIGRRWKD